MSYDISLVVPVTKENLCLDFQHQMHGGNYAVYGTNEAWLNITYNYSRWYYKDGVFPENGENKGIRSIYGMSGLESIPILENAIEKLENLPEELSKKEIWECKSHNVTGYWLLTRSNAIKPLYQLLTLAKARPDGIWRGD